jgi:phage tail-like protein
MKRCIILIFLISLILGLEFGCVPWHPPGPPGPPKESRTHFVVKWDGKVIPGITQIGALRRKTEVVEHRSGEDSNRIRRSPGRTEYQPIVLKRPRTEDKEFERWANQVWKLGSGFGTEMSLKDYRKDILIEVRDDTGKILLAFRAYRCWPSEYVALKDSDGNHKSVALEILVLEHEGWERDYEIR